MTNFSLPKPNIIDPASVSSLRWGIMGAAGIANNFVEGVLKHTKQQVVAVASRTPGKAEEFAKKFGIESHDNYEDLLSRDDIDVIYVPTLPTQHKDHALMAIAAGKHVLVEKPIALNPAEAKEIFEAAKAKGVLAMEAMWTRYLPQYDIIRQLVADNTLGEIELINVAMCQSLLHVERLFTKGGGNPIFDLGIYPVSFVQGFLGKPKSITAQAVMHANNIDEEVSVQMRFESGARAYILVSTRSGIQGSAQVGGSKAKINVGPEFFVPGSIGISDVEFNSPISYWHDETGVVGHEGLSYQATALASFVDQGLLESPYESHAESIENLETCAEITRLIGSENV